VGVDCHAVRLVLVVDDIIADCANQFEVPVELEELRFSGGIALEDPKLSFRSDANSRYTAATNWQIHGVPVRETHDLFPLHALQFSACAAVWAIANGRATATRHGLDGKRSKRCPALIRKLVRILREASPRPQTGFFVAVFRGGFGAGCEKPAATASSTSVDGDSSTGVDS
jgi:hypothetical protein